ncbi:hypothetical protein B0H14DRAFT_2614790 [Mycena olivaceomarginata]|nr:hypothetical protein B0H14DRAFT_2614790 [Mycena olivaceomarginata]
MSWASPLLLCELSANAERPALPVYRNWSLAPPNPRTPRPRPQLATRAHARVLTLFSLQGEIGLEARSPGPGDLVRARSPPPTLFLLATTSSDVLARRVHGASTSSARLARPRPRLVALRKALRCQCAHGAGSSARTPSTPSRRAAYGPHPREMEAAGGTALVGRAAKLSSKSGAPLSARREPVCAPLSALPSGGCRVHRASAPLWPANAPRCLCARRAVLCARRAVLRSLSHAPSTLHARILGGYVTSEEALHGALTLRSGCVWLQRSLASRLVRIRDCARKHLQCVGVPALPRRAAVQPFRPIALGYCPGRSGGALLLSAPPLRFTRPSRKTPFARLRARRHSLNAPGYARGGTATRGAVDQTPLLRYRVGGAISSATSSGQSPPHPMLAYRIHCTRSQLHGLVNTTLSSSWRVQEGLGKDG